MKKLVNFMISENKRIAHDTYRMDLKGDCACITAPGQFVNIALEGKYLRRPISVCSVHDDELCLIYKTVGSGTQQMSEMRTGETLELLTGLGNGFDISISGEMPILVGGGAGAAPLYGLAQALIHSGKKPIVVCGFNTEDEVFLLDDFKALGIDCYVSTADGSLGTKGFVTDVLKSNIAHDYVFACGPEPMLKALYFADDTDGQYSFESRMACGFGACMGCSCATKYGSKRICKDGPVLERGEIIW